MRPFGACFEDSVRLANVCVWSEELSVLSP